MSSSDLRHKYSCSGQTLPINLLSKEYRGTNLYHTLDSPVALQYIPYMNDYVVVALYDFSSWEYFFTVVE